MESFTSVEELGRVRNRSDDQNCVHKDTSVLQRIHAKTSTESYFMTENTLLSRRLSGKPTEVCSIIE